MPTPYKVIPRPAVERQGRRGRWATYPYMQILQTLDTDKAVLVPLAGRTHDMVITAVGKTVRRRGLQPRHRKVRAGVELWVERA